MRVDDVSERVLGGEPTAGTIRHRRWCRAPAVLTCSPGNNAVKARATALPTTTRAALRARPRRDAARGQPRVGVTVPARHRRRRAPAAAA